MNLKVSERIVNAKNFRWMEGMLAYIPVEQEFHPIRLTPPLADNWNDKEIKTCLPDPDDPATMGCLMYLSGDVFDTVNIIKQLEEV